MKKNKISVLMPVYNAGKFLKESIESILNQTYTEFEFIIINDGSTDNSKEIILSYNDKRIRYIENTQNLGIVRTLNKGLKATKGKYIARMDADDISLPHRLKNQLNFMEKHPKVGVSGGQMNYIGQEKEVSKLPLNHDEIIFQHLSKSVIAHPTVMIRDSVLKQNNLQYDIDYQYAEDYMLWVKIAAFAKLANLPDIVLKYRLHGGSITAQKAKVVKLQAGRVKKYQFEQLIGRKFSMLEKQVFQFINDIEKTNINISDFVRFLNTIENTNTKTGKYPQGKLSDIIKIWANLPLIRNNRFNLNLLYHFLFGKLRKYSSFNINGIIKYSLFQ